MSDTDAAKERRQFSWSAVGVPLFSGLVGALLGAGVSYLSTQQQIDASESEAHASFLREQRKADYSNFLGGVVESQQCIFDTRTEIDRQLSSSTFSARTISPMLDRCQEIADATWKQVGAISLVSEAALAKDCDSVGSQLSVSIDALGAYVQAVYDSDPKLKSIRSDFDLKFGRVEDMRTDLITQMTSALSAS
jgi:hypothetical protein